MTRKKAMLIFAVLAVTVTAVATYTLLPKRYRLGEHLSHATVYWNNQEAFVFLTIRTEGRGTNILQEKLATTPYGYLALMTGSDTFRLRHSAVAYRLRSSGILDRFDLPEGAGVYGDWGLRDGKLQFVPSGDQRSAVGNSALPLRWNGERFITLPPNTTASKSAAPADRNLSSGEQYDLYSEESSSREEQFKKAGWDGRTLVWDERKAGEFAMPIRLGTNAFTLKVRSLPLGKDFASFQSLTAGPQYLNVFGTQFSEAKPLWQQNGWKEVSRTEFEQLSTMRPKTQRTASSWGWFLALVALLLWRPLHWIWTLVQFATMKSGTLNKMPTAYSLPPATPAQFPFLDTANLDRYTAELESMGFTRLLDFSLVGNTSKPTPNFCRLLAHTGHHCFAEIFQFFPPGAVPKPVKCSINGHLQDGWYVSFTNDKPAAESSFLRSRKTVRVDMPEASTAELLRKFLQMREQVCVDLSISPERDDTLEAYIRRVQQVANGMRETVKQRNVAVGLSEVYFRKLSLLKTRKEYVWLGDYPKEAERRKQGYTLAGANSA